MHLLLAAAGAAHHLGGGHALTLVALLLSLFAMGATTNDPTALTGILKRQYAKGIVDAYSFMAPLAGRLIKYDYQGALGTGENYNQPGRSPVLRALDDVRGGEHHADLPRRQHRQDGERAGHRAADFRPIRRHLRGPLPREGAGREVLRVGRQAGVEARRFVPPEAA